MCQMEANDRAPGSQMSQKSNFLHGTLYVIKYPFCSSTRSNETPVFGGFFFFF